jgi:hypothetical protein
VGPGRAGQVAMGRALEGGGRRAAVPRAEHKPPAPALLVRRDSREGRERGHKSGERGHKSGGAIDEAEEAYMSCVPVTAE